MLDTPTAAPAFNPDTATWDPMIGDDQVNRALAIPGEQRMTHAAFVALMTMDRPGMVAFARTLDAQEGMELADAIFEYADQAKAQAECLHSISLRFFVALAESCGLDSNGDPLPTT